LLGVDNMQCKVKNIIKRVVMAPSFVLKPQKFAASALCWGQLGAVVVRL